MAQLNSGYNYACVIPTLVIMASASYPFAGSGYYELTAGLTYKPVKWLNLRPNVRFDYANIPVFAQGNQHTRYYSPPTQSSHSNPRAFSLALSSSFQGKNALEA